MLRSLTITTPATSPAGLLTYAEMRAAAGLDVADTSLDTTLIALEERVAASIMSECNIAVGIGAEPTLWKETLTETFWAVDTPELKLSRRHNVSIASVTEDGSAVSSGDYVADPDSGVVTRLTSNALSRWCSSKIVVVYNAGFEVIPGDLKKAAMAFMRLAYLESQRDPALKSEEVDVVDILRTSKTYWIGSVPGHAYESPVPNVVAGQLKRFTNYPVA